MFYEQNVESWGWNRLDSESRLSYFFRLWNDDFYINNQNHAIRDLGYSESSKLNDEFETHEKTYYFSITFGYRNNKS